MITNHTFSLFSRASTQFRKFANLVVTSTVTVFCKIFFVLLETTYILEKELNLYEF